ncbi:hypothetical protein P872_19445 [Rhodonellum psychrophilum GCM71 = DSM 17998]|uniref:Uncharacterized protein n=1 Tax=Rhodonellum psychrophilum GCM71 = DSM 17998 TaxID=1123057 RepID=U5BUV6_9BACT|nr:hypothetical protein P872_19445 [Rhodonellum psychrophilum GCM71 = DSM 17998]
MPFYPVLDNLKNRSKIIAQRQKMKSYICFYAFLKSRQIEIPGLF